MVQYKKHNFNRQLDVSVSENSGHGALQLAESYPSHGGRMNLLFLCSQNKRRSLTAEKLFDGFQGHKARSAGTEQNSRIKVTPGLLGWADVIFCMEKKHLRRITEKYPDIIAGKKVVCLYISDDYEYMDRELQELLKSYVCEYL